MGIAAQLSTGCYGRQAGLIPPYRWQQSALIPKEPFKMPDRFLQVAV